jgi:DNA-binding NarL/FixJ family response regulator
MNVTTTQARQEAIRLTRCEVQVLTLVMEGLTSQEVADRLFNSKRTVDYHLSSIYEKLEVNNRVQALRRAIELGLIGAV